MDWLGLIVIAAGAVASVAVALVVGTTRYRYRITVEVNTLDGTVIGSSVCEVGFRRLAPFGLLLTMFQRGEAVTIMLPSGQCLLTPYCDPIYTFLPQIFVSGEWIPLAMVLERLQREAWRFEFPPAEQWAEQRHSLICFPPLFCFADPADPLSAEYVNAANLAAICGAGVRLKSLKIEMINASVTNGLAKVLPWLPNVRGNRVRVGNQRRVLPAGLWRKDLKV